MEVQRCLDTQQSQPLIYTKSEPISSPTVCLSALAGPQDEKKPLPENAPTFSSYASDEKKPLLDEKKYQPDESKSALGFCQQGESPSKSETKNSHVGVKLVDTKSPKEERKLQQELKTHFSQRYSHLIVNSTVTPIHNAAVSRKFISQTLGGSSMAMLVSARHYDGRHLLFPLGDWNPVLPKNPGDGGLLFAMRMDLHDTDKVKSVFIHVPKKNARKGEEKEANEGKIQCWRYMGEYVSTIVAELEPEEHNHFPPHVQQKRIEKIVNQGPNCTHPQARARIVLYYKGLEATEERINEELSKISLKTSRNLSKDEVIQAIAEGVVRVSVIQLKFQSYDNDFANHMATRFPQWLAQQDDGPPPSKRTKRIRCSQAPGNQSVHEQNSEEEVDNLEPKTALGKRKRKKTARFECAMKVEQGIHSEDEDEEYLP